MPHSIFLDPKSHQWMQFRQPLVRQLAFCIASPPLLKSWPNPLANQAIDLPNAQFWQTQYELYLPRLKQLDQDSSALQQHMLTARSIRLGIRFEHLLGFWLLDNYYHPFKLIGQSIKRMDGTRTIGELDFLISNQQTGNIEHWEVAIKFYLGETAFFTEHCFADHWLGLNRRDSLGRKINHLQQHQFDVTQIEQHHIQVRRAIIKGRLFYPLPLLDSMLAAHSVADLSSAQSSLPTSWLGNQHLMGAWGHIIPPTVSGYVWRRAERQEWIVPQDMSCPVYPAIYWNNGLYFLTNNKNQVAFQYVLRIADKRCSPLKNNNILKLNTHAGDIFKQFSIR